MLTNNTRPTSASAPLPLPDQLSAINRKLLLLRNTFLRRERRLLTRAKVVLEMLAEA